MLRRSLNVPRSVPVTTFRRFKKKHVNDFERNIVEMHRLSRSFKLQNAFSLRNSKLKIICNFEVFKTSFSALGWGFQRGSLRLIPSLLLGAVKKENGVGIPAKHMQYKIFKSCIKSFKHLRSSYTRMEKQFWIY